MSPEKTKQLIDTFDFYRHEDKMHFGFECDDGWFDLLWELSTEIQKVLDELRTNQTSKERTIDLLKNIQDFTVMQVKEKFGSLRYYTNYFNINHDVVVKINHLIAAAESKSSHTCEVCGSLGYYSGKNTWIKTLCPECAKKLEYERLA